MLKADEKQALADSRARWDKVKTEVKDGASVGFKMIKDKSLPNWAGEADIMFGSHEPESLALTQCCVPLPLLCREYVATQ